jgi:hypothetical protein
VLSFLKRKKFPAVVIAPVIALTFVGPIAFYAYFFVNGKLDELQFQKDVVYVKELCTKFGGDKIYRTVDNVEGVFQSTYRSPVTDAMLRDQLGMPDPWARVQLDSENPALGVGPKAAEQGANGYWFLEQRLGNAEGPPYRRRFSTSYDDAGMTVKTLRSRYGYQAVDISTPEMRSRWIAGGRISLIDLETKEVLAERTGFFRALGPNYRDAWGGVLGTGHICPATEYMGSFVRRVLRPRQERPSEVEMKMLREE